MVQGWIRVYRKLEDNVLWKNNEPFDRRSAWIDLLLMANYKDNEILFDGKPFVVKCGQCLTSVRKLGVKWSWSKDRVLKFFRLLESIGMITKTSTNKRTLITIVNYEIYQGLLDTDKDTDQDTDKDTDKDTDSPQTISKEYKEGKEGKKDNDVSSFHSDTSCGKPSKSAKPQAPKEPEEPAVITLILNDKSEYGVTQKMIDTYKECYPALDIMQELRSMKAWCISNPTNRKTRNGIGRFINNWLSKSQNRGGGRATNNSKTQQANDLIKQLQAEEENDEKK